MPNSRDISQETWAHARQALVTYFEHRGRGSQASDLAHQTLLQLWLREDYYFEHEADFLRVCHGFAANILYESFRHSTREPVANDFELAAVVSREGGVRAAEAQVLLHEVCRIGEQKLTQQEWQLVQRHSHMLDSDDLESADEDLGRNLVRVRLHRARRKLAKLVGWKTEETRRNKS